MTLNFQEKYKDVLPAGFFEEMNKSKTAKKMAQIFMDHGFELNYSGSAPGSMSYKDGVRIVNLGTVTPVWEQVAIFCHEVVHCLQPRKKITIKQMTDMEFSVFIDQLMAVYLYSEAAAYKMSNRVLKELDKDTRYSLMYSLYECGTYGRYRQGLRALKNYRTANVLTFKTDAINYVA